MSSQQLDTSKDLAQALAESYPPLRSLWPNLSRVSPKQALFLLEPAREAFYGGAAGGGKSDALLAAALQYVDVPGYKALILRRTFTDLSLPSAIMARSQEWLTGRAHWSHERKTWTFESGATLTFGYMSGDADMARYQSAEFQYVAYDELTQFTERQYEWLFSRQRTTRDVPVPLRMRSASNPGGIGHGWVKQRFVNPATRAPDVVFVPATLEDHPDDEFRKGYRDSLSRLDNVTRRRLELGDWETAEGLAFQLADVHLVGPVDLPDAWERVEAMDFGVANPTCVLAAATDYDGNLIVFDSYYAGERLVSEHAREIEAHRKTWWPEGKYPICFADPSMWARTGGTSRWGDPATDVTEFREHGIDGLVQANNKRRPGRIRVNELLKPQPDRLFPNWHPRAGENGAPRVFFVADRCPELVAQLQNAPLLPIDSGLEGAGEIVEPKWESSHGHAVAAMRYLAMSRPSPSSEPQQVILDPRRAAMAEIERRLNDRVDDWQLLEDV